MKRLTFTLTLLMALGAGARQPDGTLDLLITPNNGVPVIIAPGQTFDAVLSGEAKLGLLQGSAPHELDTVNAWPMPGGRVKVRCRIPDDAEPGTYAMAAQADGRTDVNGRAVYIREIFPEEYRIAHITDTHIGSDRHPRGAVEIMTDVLKAAIETEPAFIAVTGDLTHDGEAGQFRAFMDVLDKSPLPTFVCPGNHDRLGLNYEQFFGPTCYMFCFGQDGYLAFDTKDFITADELGSQDARLEVYRQDIKAARWAIGLTHRYEPTMGMRSQLVLFLDNPLDHLIFGHRHRANIEGEKTVPWGTTPMTITPGAIDGVMRLIGISRGEIKAFPPEKAAAIE